MKGTRLFEDVPLLSSEYAGRVQTNKRKRGVARSLLSPSLPPSTGREHWRGELEGGGTAKEHKVTSCVAALNIKVSGKSELASEG